MNATILVVDDNAANRALAKEALEDENYRVLLATTGALGVEMFEKEQPDCVVLDVRMPDMDGFAACEHIRRLPNGADVPILFLTALRDVDTFDRALAVGGDDFLTKPVRPAELVVRVQTAIELRRARRDLREHYDMLKRQRDDLLRMQLQKERLTAFIVHDLKNPVNSMDLHAQLLLRDKALSAQSRESAGQIRAEARRLTRMIVNLLDVSKGDEGKLVPKLDVVDVKKLVADVVLEATPHAESRGVTMAVDLGVDRVRADSDLLYRTLANLVENAVKFAPAESEVTLSNRSAENCVEFEIRDMGTGIPSELQSKIFDPFVQGEDSGKASRGLGLSFCKVAVEAHGGRIWVEDANPGSRFRFVIPAGE